MAHSGVVLQLLESSCEDRSCLSSTRHLKVLARMRQLEAVLVFLVSYR